MYTTHPDNGELGDNHAGDDQAERTWPEPPPTLIRWKIYVEELVPVHKTAKGEKESGKREDLYGREPGHTKAFLWCTYRRGHQHTNLRRVHKRTANGRTCTDQSCMQVRTTPLSRVQVKITVKFPVCSKPKTLTYGVFDCDFGVNSQEWSCSKNIISCATQRDIHSLDHHYAVQ